MQTNKYISNMSRFCFVSGLFCDASTQLLFKQIAHCIGIQMLNPWVGYTHDLRDSYSLSRAVTDYEDSNFYFLFGLNIKVESPILNLRLRRYAATSHSICYYIGTHINPSFSYVWQHLGIYSDTILDFLYGQLYICHSLLKSVNPVFFYGANHHYMSYFHYTMIDLLNRNTILNISYNQLHTFASDISIHELGVTSSITQALYDSIDDQFPLLIHIMGSYRRDGNIGYIPFRHTKYKPFIIYQGCHLDEDSI